VTGRRRLQGDELREVQRASYLLHEMAERQRAYYAACAAELDLSAAQSKVLMSLRPDEAVPMRALADRVGSDPSNLTGLVDKLEARGALRRVPDPADRRVKTLRLTADGRRLRERFWHRLTHDPGPIAPLTREQVRALSELLQAALGHSGDAGADITTSTEPLDREERPKPADSRPA
jgi:DNA-binding MarR family transcriptional regulator